MAVTSSPPDITHRPLSWSALASRPVDGASLAVFRIALGAILLVELANWLNWQRGWFSEFTAPFHFTYHGFSWLPTLPPTVMALLLLVMAVCAVLVIVGWQYRPAMAVLCVGFTYFFLREKALYLNHLYLICLITLVMWFVPADRVWSVARAKPDPSRSEYVPSWALWIVRAQIAIPYFYGGIAKLGSDWLHGQPMHIWLERMSHAWNLPLLNSHLLALLMSYSGLLIDLFVVPLLFYRPTRPFALGVAIAFHLCNAVIFDIGIFPWFMIGATTLFLDPSWPRRWLRRHPKPTRTAQAASLPRLNRFVTMLLVVYFAVQLVLPFRHWLYPGQVDWTEEGSRFAWRMMLNDKVSALQLVAIDRTQKQETLLNPRSILTQRQVDKMSYDPEMLREFAAFAGRAIEAERGHKIEIHAIVYCSLNGRRPQLLVDPAVNLAAEPRRFSAAPFIVPLHEPLLAEPNLAPPEKWPQRYQLQPPKLADRY